MDPNVGDVDKLKSEISGLQNIVKTNPYSYDSHVELVTLLSKLYLSYSKEELSDELSFEQRKVAVERTKISFQKLRNARQNMNSVFPLTNELWLNWIEDEVNDSPNHEVVEDIFNKATVDYISVDVWCLYVKYLISRFDNGDCTEGAVRDALEKGVLNCGLHFRDAHKIWQCYQEFEQRCLLKVEENLKEDTNQLNIDLYKTQFFKLVKSFKRELSIPLKHHDATFTRFSDVIVPCLQILTTHFPQQDFKYISREVTATHEQTVQNIEVIEPNENNLDTHQNSLDAYESYIMNELESLSDPARIQCLFERAVVYHCLSPSIWLDYIDFLNNVIKLTELVISVCKRALRNITWDSRIFIKYANILEQDTNNVDDIRQLYEEGLQKYSNNGYNYCSILISYLSFEKRLCKNESSIIKEKPKIYNLIQQGLNQFQQLEDTDKSVVEFVLFWVDIERFWFKDEEKVKDIWKYMLSKHKCLWSHAVTYARTTGKRDLINDIFDIALLQYPEDVNTFYQAVNNYENLVGTIDSIKYLSKKVSLCKSSGIQLKKPKESQLIMSKIEHQNKFLTSWLRHAERILFRVTSSNSVDPRKTKRPADVTPKKKGIEKLYLGFEEGDQNHGQKRKHQQDKESGDGNNDVIGPVLPAGFLSSKTHSESDTDSDSESDGSDDIQEQNRDVPPSKKQKFTENVENKSSISDPGSYSADTTVFVSNLHPATKSSELEMIFSRAGEVDKVDLRKQRGGKIFAFITFKTAEAAQKAFELEHTPLYNRPIYVSEFKKTSNSDKSSNTNLPASHYSKTEEKNKLYVSNLAKVTTQNDLEKLFNQYGDMSSLRLVNKKGSTRQFAFVEYATVEAATRYLKAINGTEVRGQPIVVEFSNPSGVHQQARVPRSNFGTTGTTVSDKVTTADGEAMEIDNCAEEKSDNVFVKPKPVAVGLVPFQARNPRNLQPLKSQTTKKGPAVRINVVPAGTTTSDADGTTVDSVPEDKDKSSAATVSSARKSNEEFRKMFFKS